MICYHFTLNLIQMLWVFANIQVKKVKRKIILQPMLLFGEIKCVKSMKFNIQTHS